MRASGALQNETRILSTTITEERSSIMKFIGKLAIGAAMAGLAAVGAAAPASAAHVTVGIGVGGPGYYGGYAPGYYGGYYDSAYYYNHPCARPAPYRPDWCYRPGYYGAPVVSGLFFGFGGGHGWHDHDGWRGGWHDHDGWHDHH
jgi:hypothetical protein